MAIRLQSLSQPLKTLPRGYITASRASQRQTPAPLHFHITRAREPIRVSPVSQVRSISTELEAKEMDNSEAKGQTNKAAEDWQKRAPYKIHEPNENFKARYEASCHCGKVQYQLSRDEPLDSKLCHCTTCQTQHAAPFQWAAIFHKEDINFSHGHHDLEWYDPTEKSIEHKLPCKVRCSFCHSPIMDEGRNMILLFPSLIHLKTDEDRANFKPRCHMFYGQRVMDIPDGLPKWSGLSGSSELIEDSPKEAVQEFERNREEARKEKAEKKEKEEKEEDQ